MLINRNRNKNNYNFYKKYPIFEDILNKKHPTDFHNIIIKLSKIFNEEDKIFFRLNIKQILLNDIKLKRKINDNNLKNRLKTYLIK